MESKCTHCNFRKQMICHSISTEKLSFTSASSSSSYFYSDISNSNEKKNFSRSFVLFHLDFPFHFSIFYSLMRFYCAYATRRPQHMLLLLAIAFPLHVFSFLSSVTFDVLWCFSYNCNVTVVGFSF